MKKPHAESRQMTSALYSDGRRLDASAWIFAILTFITVLAAALGLALATMALGVSGDANRKFTVQIVDANPDIRHAQTQSAAQTLKKLTDVDDVQIVDDATVNKIMTPWLGDDARSADLPYPSLIDVTLAPSATTDAGHIADALRQVAPAARVQANASWLAPVLQTMQAFASIALLVVLALLTAIVAAVMLSARAGFNTHRETIEILHLMGSTDRQIAAMFQRRIAKEALIAGLLGTILAFLVLLALMLLGHAMASELFDAATLRWWAWIVLLAIPFVATWIAYVAARRTVLKRLAQTL